jgi:hypothetical protein
LRPDTQPSLAECESEQQGDDNHVRRCRFADNADLVGAINVLRAGYALIACEVNGEVSRQQQEPTERVA